MDLPEGMKAPECRGSSIRISNGVSSARKSLPLRIFKNTNLQKAKEAGKMRSEGRDYAMQDGDIVFFRFNV